MEVYGKSDIGLVRETNQDDIRFDKISDDVLWAVVCDGMGGANGGDIASKVASSKIAEIFKSFNAEDTQENLEFLVKFAVHEAGNLVYDMSIRDINLSGMGTTAVAAFIFKDKLHVVNVGDSRAYLINELGIKQLTVDHSVVQSMINNGDITKEQAIYHPSRNLITRSLGTGINIPPDYFRFNIEPKDTILLCTDGLTNELRDEEIYNIVRISSPQEAPEKLISAAKMRRGFDNITAALIVV